MVSLSWQRHDSWGRRAPPRIGKRAGRLVGYVPLLASPLTECPWASLSGLLGLSLSIIKYGMPFLTNNNSQKVFMYCGGLEENGTQREWALLE